MPTPHQIRFREILNSPELLRNALNDSQIVGDADRVHVNFQSIDRMNQCLAQSDREGLGPTLTNRDGRLGNFLTSAGLSPEEISKLSISQKFTYEATIFQLLSEVQFKFMLEINSLNEENIYEVDVAKLNDITSRQNEYLKTVYQDIKSCIQEDLARNQAIESLSDAASDHIIEHAITELNEYQKHLKSQYQVTQTSLAQEKFTIIHEMLSALTDCSISPKQRIKILDMQLRQHHQVLATEQIKENPSALEKIKQKASTIRGSKGARTIRAIEDKIDAALKIEGTKSYRAQINATRNNQPKPEPVPYSVNRPQ